MKNITLKIILSLVCCSFIITLVLSWTAVTNSKNVMRGEVKKELLYASQKYANQFSSVLQTQENVVDLISTMVSAEFVTEEYADNRPVFLALEKKLNEIIKHSMKTIPETKSLYLTFNPETSGGNDEVWYLRNENGEVFYMEADNTVDEWLTEGNEDSDYYYDAIKNGKNWSGVEYDMYLNTYSVTYASSCWDKNGELIGVMGTDIFIDDIFETVKNIQLNEGGSAFLMDENFNYLAGSQPENLFNEMKRNGVLNLLPEIADPKSNKNISHSTVHNERYITTYAGTSNGWILALIQSEDSMLLPIKYMNQMLIAMALLILTGVIAYAVYFSERSVMPIVKEYEQKDIVLLHQSRQAKLGEMVGNIAHQWKQPLNVMSISLSNLWDDFRNEKLTEKQLKDHIENMRLYIKNMSNTVDDFAEFLKPARKKQEFSLNQEIETALSLMAESIKINRISVEVESEEELTVYGYRNEFCQAVFNVLNNARDAIIESNPERPEIKIRICIKNKNEEKDTVIDILNNGKPIADEVKPLLFQPYYTTKEEKGGTGIGLYLTRQIIEVHMNGSIDLFNTESGVCCRIVVPKEETYHE